MRITREILLNQARENTQLLTSKDRSIICVYVTGSLLDEDPFIGGITDIDLVCVHSRAVKTRREVLRLSPEITLDVAHYEQEEFEPPRKLRTDAWLGGWLEKVPIVLFDSLRWYDFTRASATAQFWKMENVAARVNTFLVPARKTWLDLTEDSIPQGIKRMSAYLAALRNTANAVACLTGAPLAERRLVHELPARAEAVNLHAFSADFISLFTSEAVNDENFNAWLETYPQLFDALKSVEELPPSLQPFRRAYYEKAIRALYADNPAGAVWLLFYTWTRAAACLPHSEQPFKGWQEVGKQLELDSQHLPERLEALDHLLDSVEETCERLSS
jgi:hypothetical protein